MTITWNGGPSVTIEASSSICKINPTVSTGRTAKKDTANLILLSGDTTPHAKDLLRPEGRVIVGPGEYDMSGFFVLVPSFDTAGTAMPTLFLVRCERRTICYFARHVAPFLSDHHVDLLGNVDLLILPIGDAGESGGIPAEQAAKLSSQIEPRIVLPVASKILEKGKTKEMEAFLKEMGSSDASPEPKIIIKEKDVLDEEETIVRLLTPSF